MGLSGDILSQYESAKEGLVFQQMDPERGKLEVQGPDRVNFFHSMITNDVAGLQENTGDYGAFLTATGKIVADFFYYRRPQCLLVDIQESVKGGFVETLEKYIIMDDVTLNEPDPPLSHFLLGGPTAPEFLGEFFESSTPEKPYYLCDLEWQGQEVFLIRKDFVLKPGFDVLLPAQIAEVFQERLREYGRGPGLAQLGKEAYEVLRVEQGLPAFGQDMSEKNYPMEARMDQALSLSKGCYIGQEVVARATHIGGTARLLVKLKLTGDWIPRPETEVRSEQGRPIGRVTSAVYSPAFEAPLALAYLKKAFAQPGTPVKLEAAQGSTTGRVMEMEL